jgi:hypothetical protein
VKSIIIPTLTCLLCSCGNPKSARVTKVVPVPFVYTADDPCGLNGQWFPGRIYEGYSEYMCALDDSVRLLPVPRAASEISADYELIRECVIPPWTTWCESGDLAASIKKPSGHSTHIYLLLRRNFEAGAPMTAGAAKETK